MTGKGNLLSFSLFLVWISSLKNSRIACDLRRHDAHVCHCYDILRHRPSKIKASTGPNHRENNLNFNNRLQFFCKKTPRFYHKGFDKRPLYTHIYHWYKELIWLFNKSLVRIPYRYKPMLQIPQCITHMSHDAPFCNRNVHTCAHFCYKLCIVGYGPGHNGICAIYTHMH